MVGPRSSLSSLLPALQGSLLQRSTQTEAFQEAPQWVSESPWAEGQSKQCQTCSEPHSGGCRCPLSIPLVRFSSECSCGSAGTSLFQPAREACCPSAATLTVSSSPAHIARLGRDTTHMGLVLVSTHAEVSTTLCVLCTRAMSCFALAEKGPETTAPGSPTQAHVWGSVLQGQGL